MHGHDDDVDDDYNLKIVDILGWSSLPSVCFFYNFLLFPHAPIMSSLSLLALGVLCSLFKSNLSGRHF